MPIFSLDNGRLRPASSTLADDPEIAAGALLALRDQVTELLHQPFFPVAWLTETPRMGRTERQTSLVALEPSGQTVTIDVVHSLDSTVLMACLARAGRHSDLNRGRLASLYPRGTAAFRRDWQEFLDSCPNMTRPGPRLIILALDIDPDVRGALDSLLGTGVQVFRITLHESRSGILMSLDEVRPHEASFRTIAQAARREEIAAPSAITAEEFDDDVVVDWPDPSQGTVPGEEVPADSESRVGGGDDSVESEDDAEAHHEAAGDGVTDDNVEVEPDNTREADSGSPVEAEGVSAVEADVDDVSDDARQPDLSSSQADDEVGGQRAHESSWIAQPADEPIVDEDLRRICTEHGSLEVTFKSLRRRVNATGVATTDGLSVNGETYRGPDEAAAALVGREADGWRVWKLADGRKLSDLR